jgi:glutathione peroxidase
MLVKILCSLLIVFSVGAAALGSGSYKPKSILDFTMQDIDGKDVKLKKFKGNVLLVVNVASKCGFTPQYEGLQAIYEKYKAQGFTVLGRGNCWPESQER